MTTVQETPTPAEPSSLMNQAPQSISDYLSGSLRRMRSGDIGSLPIIIGLVIIAIVFQALNSNFLGPRNIVNLVSQMAAYATIAYGVVYVLLLGEIDLSISYVSAVASIGMTLLLRPPEGWPTWIPALPWWAAIGVALIAVTIIGAAHGGLITFFQLPSFVVTLAGFLIWSGVVLIMSGPSGTVIIQDQTVLSIANSFLSPELGWIAGIVFVAVLH